MGVEVGGRCRRTRQHFRGRCSGVKSGDRVTGVHMACWRPHQTHWPPTFGRNATGQPDFPGHQSPGNEPHDRRERKSRCENGPRPPKLRRRDRHFNARDEIFHRMNLKRCTEDEGRRLKASATNGFHVRPRVQEVRCDAKKRRRWAYKRLDDSRLQKQVKRDEPSKRHGSATTKQTSEPNK